MEPGFRALGLLGTLSRGLRRIEMMSAASAMMLLATELMAVTISVHFMLTSFPVDINYCIKNT